MKLRSSIKILWESFGPFRLQAGLLFVIILAAALFEALGIGMVFPLLEAAVRPGAEKTFVSRMLAFFPQHAHLLIVCMTTLGMILLKA